MNNTSDFFNLNWRDLGKGLLLAVITAVLTYVYEAFQTGGITSVDWKLVGSTALVSAVSYLFKNLLTNSEGEVLKTEESVEE